MKEFHINKSTQVKSKETSSVMMSHLLIALFPIIIFAWYKNGILPFIKGDTDAFGLFYPILFIGIPALTTYLVEVVYGILLKKKKLEDALSYSWNHYSVFVGLFLGLILPLNTPIVIAIFGSLFASIVGKLLFGGFGNNIFNPALVGYLFITLAFASVISSHGGCLNPSEVDAVTTATPLTNIINVSGVGSYKTLVKPYGNLWNFFFGTIPGAVGETSAFLILIAYIYLSIKKVIKWKIPLVYVLTVFGITFMVGNYHDLSIWYPLFQILSGGLLFGAVFMATDPVTSPTTPVGQILYGFFLGILTVIFRYLTPFPEGVMLSILTMNLFVFILDRIGSKARFDFSTSIVPFSVVWIIILALGVYLGNALETTNDKDQNYKVISREINGTKVTYVATQKGYSSTLKAEIVIDDGDVLAYRILEQNDSFYSKVESTDYLNELVQNQKDLETYDTVSGATITSTALKKLLMNTLEDYKENKNVEILPDEKPVEEPDFEILEKRKEEQNIIYVVSKKSFGGKTKAEITFNEEGIIANITLLEATDTFQEKVLSENYFDSLIENQDNLEGLDTVSGATITSTAWKKMISEVKKVYQGETDGR